MKPIEQALRRGSARPIVIATLLTLIAFVGAVGVTVWNLRETAIESANKSADQVAEIMAEEVRNSLQSIEIKLDEIVDWTKRERAERGDDFDRFMASKEAYDELVGQLGKIRQAISVSVVDADGRMIARTRAWPIKSDSIAQRDYFEVFRTSDGSALFISAPYYNRSGNALTVTMSKPIRDASGDFLGTAEISIDPTNFIPPQKVITSFQGRQFTLTRSDGVILTRMGDLRGPTAPLVRPSNDNPGGHENGVGIAAPAAANHDPAKALRLPKSAVFFDAVANGGGIYKSTQALDPRSSWIAFRPVPDYPVFVAIATLEDTLLAQWRVEAFAIGFGTAGFVVLFILLLLVIFRQGQRNLLADARFGAVMQHMSQGVAVYNSKGEIHAHNPRYEAIWGLNSDQLRPGTSFSQIKAGLIEAGVIDEQEASNPVRDLLLGPSSSKSTIRRLSNGNSIRINVDPLPDGGWITTHEDITANQQTAAQIMHLASHDSLTDLANRSLFLAQLQQRLDAAQLPFAVFLIDLDHFKDVNDSFGHGIGDELLRQVSQRLNETVRVGEVVARLGGDEFAMILPVDNNGSAGLARFADRLISTVHSPYRIDGNDIIIGLSVGIAEITSAQLSSQEVMRQSDMALFRAKQQGRNRACFFETTMEIAARSRRELAADLQGSIARGELAVFYQPIVDARTCEIRTMEALVRWPHPTRGLVPPNEFIGLAEDCGLIHKLGEFVMRRACADVATWPEHLRVAVNVSVLQATQPNFPDVVAMILTETGLAPSRLQVEITESILISDGAKAMTMFEALHRLGVEIVLDDFGTGYSSLSYLKRFPFNELKIDKSFVDDMMTHEGCAAIISATTMLASTFHITTTAEGVETRAQLDMLRAAGVNQIQGYFFARPAPADHWTRRFTESTCLSDETDKGPHKMVPSTNQTNVA